MTDATLEIFRAYAVAMRNGEPHDWQWIGPFMSQRHFGISERRAREYAAKFGGEARHMGGQS